jgi:hypothetical protein
VNQEHERRSADTQPAVLPRANSSQRAGARELGVDERTIRSWCAGQTTPPRMAFLAFQRLVDSIGKSATRETSVSLTTPRDTYFRIGPPARGGLPISRQPQPGSQHELLRPAPCFSARRADNNPFERTAAGRGLGDGFIYEASHRARLRVVNQSQLP